MAWKLYRWTWKLSSQMHIGHIAAGFLYRTRMYVPSHPVWGAATALLAREIMGHYSADCYREVGEALHRHARFGYLYPAAFYEDKKILAWLPAYLRGRGLVWIREDLYAKYNEDSKKADSDVFDDDRIISHRTFRKMLLDIRPGTAIEPDSDTAQDESLRESEVVMTRWRHLPDIKNKDDAPSGQVYMAGYLLLDDALGQFKGDRCKEISAHNLCNKIKGLQELFVGGDLKYGLGHMVREGEPTKDSKKMFGLEVGLNGKDPVVSLRSGGFVPAHCDGAGEELGGDMELMVSWDRSKASTGGPYWVPGSVWLAKEEAKRAITEGGILRKPESSATQKSQTGGN